MDSNETADPIQRALISSLSACLLDRRLASLKQTIQNRTRYITILLEDIFQSQNASAALRTCECLGIQDVHLVENRNTFSINPRVVRGSARWLTIHRHNALPYNTTTAIAALREQGYRIVATSPHLNSIPLHQFDVSKGRFALLFGTERAGLSASALTMVDEQVRIPMVGFTESINLSVSVGICLHFLALQLRKCEIDIGLSAHEQQQLLHQWLRQSVKSWRSIEHRAMLAQNEK